VLREPRRTGLLSKTMNAPVERPDVEKRSLVRPGTASFGLSRGDLPHTGACGRSIAQCAPTNFRAVWQTRAGAPAEGKEETRRARA
jgi:hypothetical protein